MTKSAKTTPAKDAPADVTGELAALSVLYAVTQTLRRRKRRQVAKALLALIDDWTRGDPADAPAPAQQAMRRSAERFARPAARMLLADAAPVPPIKRT